MLHCFIVELLNGVLETDAMAWQNPQSTSFCPFPFYRKPQINDYLPFPLAKETPNKQLFALCCRNTGECSEKCVRLLVAG